MWACLRLNKYTRIKELYTVNRAFDTVRYLFDIKGNVTVLSRTISLTLRIGTVYEEHGSSTIGIGLSHPQCLDSKQHRMTQETRSLTGVNAPNLNIPVKEGQLMSMPNMLHAPNNR